jgi:putative hydrolase of the HAD superfamily
MSRKIGNDSESKKVLVFDAVGTLIRPAYSVSQTYFEFGQRFGSRLSSAAIKTRFGKVFHDLFRSGKPTNESIEFQNWQQLVAQVFSDLTDTHQIFDSLWNHFAKPDSWQVFDDVQPNWSRFVAQADSIAIASNFDKRLLKILDAHPPLNEIDAIFISSEIGWPKPTREFFAAIENRCGSKSIYTVVGDDPICDIQPAQKIGWKTVLIDRQQANSDELRISSLNSLEL